MQLAVMDAANRDRELVAHAMSKCTRLCKLEVMRIRVPGRIQDTAVASRICGAPYRAGE
jgi:hypothetical protein